MSSMSKYDEKRATAAVRELLASMGLEGTGDLRETPERVARMLPEILEGVLAEPEPVDVMEGHDDPVLIENIRFFSLCEHHLLPFFGRATVGYIPGGGRITGLGTICRMVDHESRRPTLQERLAEGIANRMEDALAPKGVYVRLEADQLCIMMRGPRQMDARTITVVRRGLLKTEEGMGLLFERS